MRVAVVGGGIAGVFTSYFLKKAGVEVLGFGGNLEYPLASLVLTMSMPDPRDIEMAKESLEVYKSIDAVEPVTSVDILPEGVDLSPLRRAGVKYTIVDRYEGLRLERGEVGVITTDYMIPIRRIVKRLRRELGFLDAEAKLAVDGGTVYIKARGEKIKADAVVLAAGASNADIARDIGLRLPFKPYSCYAALFLVPPRIRGLSIGDYVLGWYGRPGLGPFYIAGDGCGRAYSGPPKGYARKIGRLISRRAGWAVPIFAKSGICEGSPTGGPLMGRVPYFDNLYVIGGLDGYGSMVGPALAKRLASAIVKGSTDEVIEEYDGYFDPCVERHDWGVFFSR